MTGRKGLDAAWISHTTWPRGATFVDAERIARAVLQHQDGTIGAERTIMAVRHLHGLFVLLHRGAEGRRELLHHLPPGPAPNLRGGRQERGAHWATAPAEAPAAR